jgi:hypothetical protein
VELEWMLLTRHIAKVFFSSFLFTPRLLVMKVYPGQRAGGIEADMMAANELNAHAVLQVGYRRLFKY